MYKLKRWGIFQSLHVIYHISKTDLKDGSIISQMIQISHQSAVCSLEIKKKNHTKTVNRQQLDAKTEEKINYKRNPLDS